MSGPERANWVRLYGTEIAADSDVIAMGPWSLLIARWLPLPPVAQLEGHEVTLAPRFPVGPPGMLAFNPATLSREWRRWLFP